MARTCKTRYAKHLGVSDSKSTCHCDDTRWSSARECCIWCEFTRPLGAVHKVYYARRRKHQAAGHPIAVVDARKSMLKAGTEFLTRCNNCQQQCTSR